MKIYRLLPVLALLLLFSPLAAQELTRFNQNFNEFIDEFEMKRYASGELPENSYTGSPYLNNEFTEGDILSSDGRVYRGVPLRYNIYNDVFEFSKDEQVLALERSEKLKEFIIGERRFVYCRFIDNKREKMGYLEVISTGDFNAYIRYTITLRPAEEPAPYKEARKAAFTPPGEEYLVSGPDRDPTIITGSRDLSELFPGKAEKIDSLTGGKRLKFKNSDDVAQFVEQLNSDNNQ